MKLGSIFLPLMSLSLITACSNSASSSVKNGVYYQIQYDYDSSTQKTTKTVIDYELDKIGADGVKYNGNNNWRYCYGFIVKGNKITSYALSWDDNTKEVTLESNANYEFDTFGHDIVITLSSVDSVDDYLFGSTETILYKDGCFALKSSGSNSAGYYVTLDYAKRNGINIRKM